MKESHKTNLSKTKNKFLLAAFKLFSTKGYENASVEDIVNEAGYTKGGFYHYFKSKEELFLDIIDFRLNQQQEIVLKALNFNQSLPEIINNLFGMMIRMTKEEGWTALYLEFLTNATRNEKVKERISKMYNNWREFVKILLLSLQANDKISKDLQAEKIASMIIAIFDGFNIQSLIDPQLHDLEYSQEFLKEILLFKKQI